MPNPKPRVLLVGWDSADWQVINPLMDRGEMPLLRKLVESGVKADLSTLRPMLSPMLWTSIATGKRAYDHGVLGFTEVDSLTGNVRPVSASTRRCKTLWDILSDHDLKAHVVGWFSTHGEQRSNGITVSNLFSAPTAPPGQAWPPAPRGTFWPESLGDSLNEFRVSPEEIDGSILGLFVPEFRRVDTEKDHRLGHLRIHLAESLSVQAATTWLMEHEEWDFLAVYFRAIDEISHHFMPFHPPQVAGIPDELFGLYQHVINSTYRYHDLMLAQLVALAGPDTHVIVVSDHGFHSGALRPRFVPRVPAGITVWHRPHGILAAAGPQFRRDELVFGASLLDITPTILTMFGLPVGVDMEGKVLTTAFAEPPQIQTCPSWETTGSIARTSLQLSEAESRALLDQFVALGYLEPLGNNASEAARVTDQENRWTLARAYLDGNRPAEALPLLEQLHAESPDRTDFAIHLIRCQIHLGLRDEARAITNELVTTYQNSQMARLLQAQMALDDEDYQLAAALLEQAREGSHESPDFWLMYARTWLGMRQWREVESAAAKVIAVRPDDASAWLMTAMARLRLRSPEEAAEAALEAINLDFTLIRAHFILGLSQWNLHNLDRAEQAWKACVRMAPHWPASHAVLSRLYRRKGQHLQAEFHANERRRLIEARPDRYASLWNLRTASLERARKRAKAAPPASESLPPLPPGPSVPRDILIVTGLPRSGTSLLMQLLHRGGYPILTDGVRTSDGHNPEGYFEWEEARKLRRHPQLIEKAADQAVKVIAALLPHLPRSHRYRVILVVRPLREVARSQHRMRFGDVPPSVDLESQVVPLLEKHLAGTRELLRQAGLPVLEIAYRDLMSSPTETLNRLVTFVGAARLPHRDQMITVIRPDLYRERDVATPPKESGQV